MSSSQQFTDVLRRWSEVFMHRSMRDFMQFTKNSGLSMSQFSTLFRLYHGERCGVGDIGDHLGVSDAAASQMVERLVQQGILERTEDPRDRRVKHIALSPKGRLLIEESIEARRRWMEQLTTALTAEEQEAIVAALTILTQAALKLDNLSQAQE